MNIQQQIGKSHHTKLRAPRKQNKKRRKTEKKNKNKNETVPE